jgi:type IV secretory pathway VirB2 component (pilin)
MRSVDTKTPKGQGGRLSRGWMMLAFVGLALLSPLALAANGGPTMPWDSPGTMFMNALTGTTAHICAVIAIALAGIGTAFTDHGTLWRKGAATILGISVTMGAGTLLATLGLTGAVI